MNVEKFLVDMTYNTRYQFLEWGKDDEEIKDIAKKRGIKLPTHDLAMFKCIYGYVDRQNLNGCTLPKAEVEKALDTLVSKAVDFDHMRKRVVGHWLYAKIKDKEIIAYGAFYKSNFEEDYDTIKELFEGDNLAISFEAWGKKDFKSDGSYNLTDIEFAGGALLLKEPPAFSGTGVIELAKKEKVLEFAKVMTEPENFVKVKSCDECISEEEIAKLLNIEISALPKEVTNCVKAKTKAGVKPADAVKQCWAEFKKSKGTEDARYGMYDYEAIQKIVSEADKPKGEEGNYAVIQAIDFKEQKITIRYEPSNTIGVIDLSNKPKVKIVKKGDYKPGGAVDTEVFKSAEDYLEVLQTFEGSADDLEKAWMEEIEYGSDCEIEKSKELTYKERQKISDKMFAVVKIVKNKITGKPRKIRMFPIHDPAHVRSALARLPQAKETLRKLGVSTDMVKRKILKRARELNMKDLLERYSKADVEGQTVLFAEIAKENESLKTQLESKDTEIEKVNTTVAEKDAELAKKDKEIATVKEELEKVKKEAEDAKAEIAKRDEEIKKVEVAKRKEELGEEWAKDISDEDIMNDLKFENAKLKKELAEAKDEDPNPGNKSGADLIKGSKDKKKESDIVAASKRVKEKAYGKTE